MWRDAFHEPGALDGSANGALYQFRYVDADTGWVQERKLNVLDGASGDGLGSAVALWGDMALAGTPQDDDLGTNSGSAHLISVPEPHPLLGLSAGVLALTLLHRCRRTRLYRAVPEMSGRRGFHPGHPFV